MINYIQLTSRMMSESDEEQSHTNTASHTWQNDCRPPLQQLQTR